MTKKTSLLESIVILLLLVDADEVYLRLLELGDVLMADRCIKGIIRLIVDF